jgi:hypothetical protein
MKYSDEQLNKAVENNIFTQEQVDDFKTLVNNQISKSQKVLYYGGCLLIISAMTWLMKSSWDSFGSIAILCICIVYFVMFFTAGYIVFFKKNLQIAGGLLLAVPIAIMPLMMFSALKLLDFWPLDYEYNDYYIWIKGKWLILEISTIVVALPILYKTKFPFHVFLIAGSLWFLSMDIVPIIYKETYISWTKRATISEIFGTAMIMIGYIADIKLKKDYSFWLYLFGLLTLSSGMSVFYNANITRFVILGIVNLVLMVIGLFLNRNAFIVFATIGLTEFLARLAWEFFEGSYFFPFALTIIGVLLIIMGIYFQRNKAKIDENMRNKLPPYLIRLRPKRY